MDITNQGAFKFKSFNTIRVEPDGSLWYQICHHKNPTSYKFSSSNDFANGVFIDNNRWFSANICNELTSWEFLWIQNAEKDSPSVKLRWTQTVNPFNATYADVAPGKVTYDTSQGYTTSTYGGLYKINRNTYFCVANAIDGNWYGAAGAWSAHGGGIPGFPGLENIITGTLNLYVRITDRECLIRNIDILNATNFYEI